MDRGINGIQLSDIKCRLGGKGSVSHIGTSSSINFSILSLSSLSLTTPCPVFFYFIVKFLSTRFLSFSVTLCLSTCHLLPLPSLSIFHMPSLSRFLPLRCVFFAMSDMAMERNWEMILPPAWWEQRSHYNSADVYCCWQCRAHCNMNTRTHTEPAHGCTTKTDARAHTHTQRDVHVTRPGLE